MKKYLCLLVAFALCLLGGQFSAQAAPRNLGLDLSLITSATKFTAPAANSAPKFFNASAVLTNRSGEDLSFDFPDPASAAVRFTFRLQDADGAVVWESDLGVGAEVATAATLKRRSNWRRNEAIPLNPGGIPLNAGYYTLTASLTGTPKVAATVFFKVEAPANPEPENPSLAGIKGQVVRAGSSLTLNSTTQIIPAEGVKARISVYPLGSPSSVEPGSTFSKDLITDENGYFSLSTPPGRYVVSAHYIGRSLPPAQIGYDPGYASAQTFVTVMPRTFAEVQLTLRAGDNYYPDLLQSGISGQVLRDEHFMLNSWPVQTGVSSSPIPGARLEITPLIFGYSYVGLPFLRSNSAEPVSPVAQPRWITTADAEGRFSLKLAEGTYRVRVYGASDLTLATPLLTTTTSVIRRQFTELELHHNALTSAAGVAQPVAQVTAVRTVSRTDDELIIETTGTVPSSGWRNVQLAARAQTYLFYTTNTAQGSSGASNIPIAISDSLDFDLIAEPPVFINIDGQATVVTPAFETVTARVTIHNPSNVRRISVHAGNSQLTLTYPAPVPIFTVEGPDRVAPTSAP